MNTIRPRYPQQTQGYQTKQGATDENGHNQNSREQQQNQRQTVARGRAQEQQENNPAGQRNPIYSPAANAYSKAINNTTQSYAVHTPPTIHHNQPNAIQYQTIQNGYYPMNQPVQQVSMGPKQVKSNKVNIAQILKDFRNTIKAIATPPDIEEQVEEYLKTVIENVKTSKPQVKLVQSNLKIAASILDKYISETLNKESKVVQNWLDALFLQRIDYAYNENDINPNFLVQFPDNNNTPSQEEVQQEITQEEIQPQIENVDNTGNIAQTNIAQTNENVEYQDGYVEIEPEELTLEEEFTQAKHAISQKPNISIIPQDTKLKSLFVEAKKHAFNNNPQRAMMIFKEAFNRASEINDKETQSRICLEIGKIYDDNDHVVQALNSYNKSLQYTTDVNVKSKAHYSMAQIYDDVNQIEPAMNHYFTSISYAGKSDDLIGQSDSLTKMDILTDKYSETAFDYYETARKLVEQTSDFSMKGYVLSNTAEACVQFKKNDKALKFYAEAVKNYEKTNSNEDVALNYKAAAELMLNFNCPHKAQSLLKKALVHAVKTTNEDLISEINVLLLTAEE